MVHQPASGDFIQESRSTYSVSNLNSKLFSRNIFAIENMYWFLQHNGVCIVLYIFYLQNFVNSLLILVFFKKIFYCKTFVKSYHFCLLSVIRTYNSPLEKLDQKHCKYKYNQILSVWQSFDLNEKCTR